MSEVRPSLGYIPNTPEQQQEMLVAVGASNIHELFPDIPHEIYDPALDLPRPLTEIELDREMKSLGAKNRTMDSFLGYGAYRRFQPAIVADIIRLDGFLTSYTPYQAEISQGTLKGAFEYQTMMCELFGMDVSNTGMYDGATAMAEAALMVLRIKSKSDPQRRKIVALNTVHPHWREVTNSFLSGEGLELEVVDEGGIDDAMRDAAGVIVQSPNYLGNIEELKELGEKVHDNGALFIVASDPISLGLLEVPGKLGADIAVGEGQSLGNPLHFGGVNLGIFTARNEYLRQMPGRITGRTLDRDGKEGYALTLQAREQHIRRENATSNICTAEQLVALASTIYLASLGPRGLKQVAQLNYQNAHYLALQIGGLPGFSLSFPNSHFFNEFVVECPRPPSEINRDLLEENIIGGKDVSDVVPNGMLLCATEVTTKEQIDNLVSSLRDLN